MHLRNRTGRTPLFLAANAGFSEHVLLLRKSGAHLHSDERAAAELLARRKPGVWALAGVGPRKVSDRELEETEMVEDGGGGGVATTGRMIRMPQRAMAGSAPS